MKSWLDVWNFICSERKQTTITVTCASYDHKNGRPKRNSYNYYYSVILLRDEIRIQIENTVEIDIHCSIWRVTTITRPSEQYKCKHWIPIFPLFLLFVYPTSWMFTRIYISFSIFINLRGPQSQQVKFNNWKWESQPVFFYKAKTIENIYAVLEVNYALMNHINARSNSISMSF